MAARSEPESTSLAARILAATSTLSRAERRIVRVLYARNFRIGGVPVASLAEQAGVSGPTIIRFMGRLGYNTYRSLQEAAEAQSGGRLKSPAVLYQRGQLRKATDLETVAASVRSSVQKTLAMADAGEIAKIIRILVNERRHIVTIGGRGSDIFAQMLAARLYQVRPHVRAGRQHLGYSLEDQLSFMSSRDVVVAFDFRRYEDATIHFARCAAEQGATIVLITDTWLSPIADFAQHVLTIHSNSGGPYDYWTPCMALLETVLEMMLAEMDPEAAGERIQLTEKYVRGLIGVEESAITHPATEEEQEQ